MTRFLVLPDPDTELQEDGHEDVLQVCSYRISGMRPDIKLIRYPASPDIRLDEYLNHDQKLNILGSFILLHESF